ncbi:hypothetical protein D3C83_44350 [compost metagenome]
MRGAAHEHELAHREGEIARVALRDVASAAGDLGARKVLQLFSLERYRPALGVQQAEHGAEQRGLAAAVRPQHAEHLARREREARVAADGASGKAEGEVADLQFLWLFALSRRPW